MTKSTAAVLADALRLEMPERAELAAEENVKRRIETEILGR